MKTVMLTEEQLERLKTVVACNIDLNIQKNINEAMKAGNESAVQDYIKVKEFDNSIIEALHAAR